MRAATQQTVASSSRTLDDAIRDHEQRMKQWKVENYTPTIVPGNAPVLNYSAAALATGGRR